MKEFLVTMLSDWGSAKKKGANLFDTWLKHQWSDDGKPESNCQSLPPSVMYIPQHKCCVLPLCLGPLTLEPGDVVRLPGAAGYDN